MPTLATFGSCVIRVYKNEHGAPHFHILGPNFEGVVEIATLRILEGDQARVQRYAGEALAWADAHRQELLDAWRRFNPGR